MSCATLVVSDIVNDCTKRPVKGLKPKAWVFNMGEAVITKTANKITGLTKASGKTSFTVEGFKDFMNAGYEAVIAENLPTAFKHKFNLNFWGATAAEKANVDSADNILVIVQANGSQLEGCFLAYGINNGLWKSAQSKMANDNQGVNVIEFATREGQGEDYSEYVLWVTDYATTLAALVATES